MKIIALNNTIHTNMNFLSDDVNGKIYNNKKKTPKIPNTIIVEKASKKDKDKKNIPKNIESEIEIKLSMIENIIKMFPELKKHKDIIMTELVYPKKEIIDNVLNLHFYNNKIIYIDKSFSQIVDNNGNLIGIWSKKNIKLDYDTMTNILKSMTEIEHDKIDEFICKKKYRITLFSELTEFYNTINNTTILST